MRKLALLAAFLPALALAQAVRPVGKGAGEYAPNQPEGSCGVGQWCPFIADPDGRQIVSAQVLTDEGGLYEPFAGTSLDPTVWTSAVGTGTTLSVANSYVGLGSGTTNGSVIYISAPVDYAPIRAVARIQTSNRIANQDMYFQLGNNANPTLATQFVRWHFTGTNATLVRCETQSSIDNNGNEGKSTDLTLPNGVTSGSWADYTLALSHLRLSCGYGSDTLESTLLAQYAGQLPNPYEPLWVSLYVVNGTGVAGGAALNADYIKVKNDNRLEISNNFTGEPAAMLAETDVIADGQNQVATVGNPHNMHQDTYGRLFVRDYASSYWSTDVSTGAATVTATTQVAALSGVGLSYYVTDVLFSNGAGAQTIAVVSSATAGNACATSPVNVVPPVTLPANAGMVWPLKTPIKVTANHALCCKTSGGTAYSCALRGFTAP